MNAARWLALAVVLALGAGACHRLDPREPSTRAPERSVWGGWVVVYLRSGAKLQGELLAVSGGQLHVLAGRDHGDGRGWVADRVTSVALREVRDAEVHGYEPDSFWSYGYLAALYPSFALLLPPILISVAVVNADQKLEAHSSARYAAVPRASEAKAAAALSRWARFPQGLPRGLDPRSLLPPPLLLPPAATSR